MAACLSPLVLLVLLQTFFFAFTSIHTSVAHLCVTPCTYCSMRNRQHLARCFRGDFRWTKRILTTGVALSTCYGVYRISDSMALAVALSGGLVVMRSTVLQWRAMRQTRARWQTASEVVSLVLRSLKDEATRAEPQTRRVVRSQSMSDCG